MRQIKNNRKQNHIGLSKAPVATILLPFVRPTKPKPPALPMLRPSALNRPTTSPLDAARRGAVPAPPHILARLGNLTSGPAHALILPMAKPLTSRPAPPDQLARRDRAIAGRNERTVHALANPARPVHGRRTMQARCLESPCAPPKLRVEQPGEFQLPTGCSNPVGVIGGWKEHHVGRVMELCW